VVPAGALVSIGARNADPTRDTRTFRHYAVLDASGTVVAVIEQADGTTPTGSGTTVEITDLYPHDVHGRQIAADALLRNDHAELHALLQIADRGRPTKGPR
jgi:hypothetical protein